MSIFASWQFLISISIFAISVASILQKVLMKDKESDPVVYAIVFQIFVAIIIGIYALSIGFHLPNFAVLWPNILLMIFLYAVCNVLNFTSLQLIDASEFTVLYTTRSVWTILSAFLFLGEHFLLIQFAGTFLIFLSVIIISLKEKKFILNKGVLLALTGACATGIAFVNDAFVIRSSQVASYETIAFLLPGIALALFYPKSLKHLKGFLHIKRFLKMFLFSFFYAIGAFTVYLAYKYAHNASELSVISQLVTIFTVLLAVVFLKETSHLLKKILAAIIAFVGVVLIGK